MLLREVNNYFFHLFHPFRVYEALKLTNQSVHSDMWIGSRSSTESLHNPQGSLHSTTSQKLMDALHLLSRSTCGTHT